MKDKDKELAFYESLKSKTPDELEGILVAYCSSNRRLWAIKQLGFQPNYRIVMEEIFAQKLHEVLEA